MKVVKILRLVFCCLQMVFNIQADQKGSESLVSIEPFFTFPATPLIFPNQMLAFGFFKNGFALQDATTTCSFESAFPVAGNISLHGGQLYLVTDLHMSNVSTLVTSGKFYGNDAVLELSESVTGIPAVFDTAFKNINIFMNSDLLVSGTVKVKGQCIIDGQWNRMTMDTGANIVIQPGSQLTLRNMQIDNLRGSNIRCLDNGGVLILDDLIWAQDDNFTFSNGSIKFNNLVTFVAPHAFTYESKLTSTIEEDSTWFLSEFTKLSIGRQGSIFSREPLYFTDDTSTMKMSNVVFNVTRYGMSVTRGTMLVDGEVKFDIDSTNSSSGLIFGDGTLAGDMALKYFPGAAVNFERGDLVHNVVGFSNFVTSNVDKIFIRQGTGANYWSLSNSHFTNVELVFGVGGTTFLAPGKFTYFNNVDVRIPSLALEFTLTATRITDFSFGLYSGGKVAVSLGDFIAPLGVVVRGSGNILTTPNNVSAGITINDGGSALNLGINGFLLSKITMNGGTVNLTKDLSLAQAGTLTGTGSLNLSQYNLNLSPIDFVWTPSVTISSSSSKINMRGRLSLTTTMTINGTCEILGNGEILRFMNRGALVVGKNSTLTLKNIVLEKAGANQIRCFDNSAKIILQDTTLLMDRDFSFTVGALKIKGDCHFIGNRHSFIYQSNLTSTIEQLSTLFCDEGLTFSYDPLNGATNLLAFQESTSKLSLNDSNLYIAQNGMQMTNGGIIITGDTTVFVENDSSLTIGNSTSTQDVNVHFDSGSVLDLLAGSFVYKNVNEDSWQMTNINSILRIESGATLDLRQPMVLGDGRLLMHINSHLLRTQPEYLDGNVEFFDS